LQVRADAVYKGEQLIRESKDLSLAHNTALTKDEGG